MILHGTEHSDKKKIYVSKDLAILMTKLDAFLQSTLQWYIKMYAQERAASQLSGV
jgi:hypothetical protein